MGLTQSVWVCVCEYIGLESVVESSWEGIYEIGEKCSGFMNINAFQNIHHAKGIWLREKNRHETEGNTPAPE